jgi:hemerythrin-like domain-containing protein
MVLLSKVWGPFAGLPGTHAVRQASAMKKPKAPRPAGEPHSAQTFMARLRLDHARLSRVLREIEVQRVRLGREPDAARAVLTEALQYLVEYQHRHHHPREDRLYARLALARGDLGAELRKLGREHEDGASRARGLAAELGTLPPTGANGRAGGRFARALQAYVDQARDHMRREERAIFYAGVEPWLSGQEWQALSAELVPDDPLGDAAHLRRHYPHLAAALLEPVRDVSSVARAAAASGRAHARSLEALRDGAEDLVEAYGELVHEGLDLVRSNVAALWGAPSPLGAVEALPELGRRSYLFAARCFTLPSRVALECASRMLTPLGTRPERPVPKK